VAVVYLLLTLGVGGILAWFGRRELTGLSHIYTKALNEHAEHGELLQQQAWLRTGQSELAQQGIGQLALPQLSSALLQFLARYMGVVVGALPCAATMAVSAAWPRMASATSGSSAISRSSRREPGGAGGAGAPHPPPGALPADYIQVAPAWAPARRPACCWRRSTATAKSTA
jgi:hypothetical protein